MDDSYSLLFCFCLDYPDVLTSPAEEHDCRSSIYFLVAVHILLSWIFVNILDWGVSGAMGAYSISSWLLVFGEYVYVFGGWCPNTWKGFTKAAFYDILPVIKLSISSGVMLW
jgi:Na+-driven multidrug efflux pump